MAERPSSNLNSLIPCELKESAAALEFLVCAHSGGAVAQSVERGISRQEVIGSTPSLAARGLLGRLVSVECDRQKSRSSYPVSVWPSLGTVREIAKLMTIGLKKP